MSAEPMSAEPAPPEASRYAALAQILTRPASLTPPGVPAVLAAGLGGAIRAHLPAEHPLREALRPQALNLALRHAHIRAEVRPLLRAWAEAGIPALLFKGFALAEFEYSTPGERFYGDVDLLLPEDLETVMRAAHIAIAHGWRSDGQHAEPGSWTHETMHLYSPGGHVRLDVHRWVVARSTGASPRRLRRLSAGYWQRARQVDWDGVPALLPSPLDAAAVIVLGRSWGGDSGGFKPADYLDLQLLQRRYGLSDEALTEHLGGLGGGHTWRAFHALCDPRQGRLSLDPEQTAPLLSLALSGDGLSKRRGYLRGWVSVLSSIWPELPGALGDVLAAWWALRRGGDPRTHLRRWTPAGTARLPQQRVNRRLTAVRWWTRLLYPRQSKVGVCVPRAYASYRSLRRLGHPVFFVSGAARHEGQFVAHAWVEDERGAFEEYGEPFNRQRFHEVFSYPPKTP